MNRSTDIPNQAAGLLTSHVKDTATRYHHEFWRLTTFVHYPPNSPVSALLLARQGFMYIGGGLGDGDTTIVCVFCLLVLSDVKEVANVEETHRTLKPDCVAMRKYPISSDHLQSSGEDNSHLYPQPLSHHTHSDPSLSNTRNVRYYESQVLPSEVEVPEHAVAPVWRNDDVQYPVSDGVHQSLNHSNIMPPSSRVHSQATDWNHASQVVTTRAQTLSFPGEGAHHDSVTDRLNGFTRIQARPDGQPVRSEYIEQDVGSSHSNGQRSSPPCQDGLIQHDSQQTHHNAQDQHDGQSHHNGHNHPDGQDQLDGQSHHDGHNHPDGQDQLDGQSHHDGHNHPDDQDQRDGQSHHDGHNYPDGQDQHDGQDHHDSPDHYNEHDDSDPRSIQDGHNGQDQPDGRSEERGQTENTSLEKLGIVTSRPRWPEFAVEPVRSRSFHHWPSDHHIKPEGLVKAGFFYTGNGDCVRCFYCGGGLRNWEPGDHVWVEHARWFPKCAFVLQKVGTTFINIVENLGKEQEILPVEDVLQEMKRQGCEKKIPEVCREEQTTMEIEKGPAVKLLIDVGCKEDDVIKAAMKVKAKGSPLAVDHIYEELPGKLKGKLESTLRISSTSECVSRGKRDFQKDQATIKSLEDKRNELRELSLCKVCWDKEVTVVLLPCGHFISCSDCSFALNLCPLCRMEIKGVVHANLMS